ncbi:MAG: hypothetical protein EZS28_012636 [Streblomastix strix]|uniref:Uncharacterized protein n=1 Tax=Streblomastix strix TaxID=222440 RepID=A0A5J4WAZ7_9EUKA|nr:MAG: hypothetical protein EZS28_012636 [Streblomastix strix]
MFIELFIIDFLILFFLLILIIVNSILQVVNEEIKIKKNIFKALNVKRRRANAAEFSEDEYLLLDATMKVRKRHTYATAASTVSTNASFQALESFNISPKKRMKLLLRNFRLSSRSAQLSSTSRENWLLSFQGQHIVAAAPPTGAFISKRLNSLSKFRKYASKLGIIRDLQVPRISTRPIFKCGFKKKTKRGRHQNSVSRRQVQKQKFLK